MTGRRTTATHEPTTAADTKSGAAERTADVDGLNAEIVRDLDLDGRAEDVRGGCKTTQPCGTTRGGF